jgi:3-dehydroquinate synthetase
VIDASDQNTTHPAVPVVSELSSSTRLTGTGRDVLRMESQHHQIQNVTLTRGLLSASNTILRDCVGSRGALVVYSSSVARLYGRQIRDYFESQVSEPANFMVVDRAESSKSMAAVIEVCERAADVGLGRTSPIIAIGGGVCSDISGLAASLYRRGVPHINIPTTLIGLIDAGIGTKTAVNHGGRKSALGAFHPPEHSLLDAGFLVTLPRRHLRNGLAEIIKLATVSSPELFTLLARDVSTLTSSNFQTPSRTAERVILLSVNGMLTELSHNLFETADYRRKVDFGHTFSPYFEVASGHAILHGEAVALDIALSSQIATILGILTEEDLDQILSLIQESGLSLSWGAMSVDTLWASLPAVAKHRDGDLNLVVPVGIGACDYLGMGAISPQLLRAGHERLQQRSHGTSTFSADRLDVSV